MKNNLVSGDVKVDNPFGDKKIIVTRFAGDLKKAYLEEDGTTVKRSTYIEIPPFDGYPAQRYLAAPYDNHFVFRHVYNKKGRIVRGWTLWCTCSAPAAIVDYDGYSNNASPSGQMVVCLFHSQYGKHADGSS